MTLRLDTSRLSRRATVKRAAMLLDEDRADEARALLARTLHHPDPANARASRHLFDAAVLYVKAVGADTAADPSALAWARYAHRAAQQLHGGDLEILQDGAEVLASALDKHGASPDETAAACREVVHHARERGQLATAMEWQIGLATYLHAHGRCAAAAEAALAGVRGCPPNQTAGTVELFGQAFIVLDACHRHDDASTVATQLRVTDLPASTNLTQELDVVEGFCMAVRAHTERYHGDAACPLTHCSVPGQAAETAEASAAATAAAITNGGDAGASARDDSGDVDELADDVYLTLARRVFAGFLDGLDPVQAPAHGPLADIAERYAALADQHARPSTLAWARYAHRARLAQMPRLGLAADQELVVLATNVYTQTLQWHGHPDPEVTAWRDAVQHADDRGDPDAVDICRAHLAEILYSAGRCAEALAEIATAIGSWQQRRPAPDTNSVGMAVQAAFMYGGCHRHDEVTPYGAQIQLDSRSDADRLRVLGLLGYFGEQAQEHARTYHPHDPCEDPSCLTALVAATAAEVTDAAVAATPATPAPPSAVRQAGEKALTLFAEQRYADVSKLLATCLADFDPATVAADGDLAAVAAMYAFTTMAGPGVTPSPRAWARYAYHVRRVLRPNQPLLWIEAGRIAARRADEECECGEAIQLATDLLDHALHHSTPTEQAGIRLDLADYLLSAGRCTDGVNHARIAWTSVSHEQPPADDQERFARLLVGIRSTCLLGGCHQHEDAVSTMFDALERYTGPEPADPNGLEPAVREERWQSTITTYLERRERHRAAHHHSPCDDEHHGEIDAAPGEHLDQILALINARTHRETPSMTATTRASIRVIAAALGVAALLVPLASLAASPTVGRDGEPRDGGAGRSVVSFGPASPAGVTAQGMLADIARNARSAASDQQSGTSSCLHLMRWDRSPGVVKSIETDSIRQVNPDGSGLLFQQTNAFRRPPPTLTLFAAGELRSPIGEPMPTDPVRLADAVTEVVPPGSGSTAVVAVLLDLTGVRILNLAERVAVVRVLAGLLGVSYLGRMPGRDGGTGYEFRFDDDSGDPIDVCLDPDTGDILGYRLGGLTALQSSSATLILRRTRCDCPPLLRIAFVGAVFRMNLPPTARCATPPGAPTFYPAGTQQGTHA